MNLCKNAFTLQFRFMHEFLCHTLKETTSSHLYDIITINSMVNGQWLHAKKPNDLKISPEIFKILWMNLYGQKLHLWMTCLCDIAKQRLFLFALSINTVKSNRQYWCDRHTFKYIYHQWYIVYFVLCFTAYNFLFSTKTYCNPILSDAAFSLSALT